MKEFDDFMDEVNNEIKAEMKVSKEERENYLSDSKKDFSITLDGFIFVEDSDILPLSFETCICVLKEKDDEDGEGEYYTLVGVWDESRAGRSEDKRGSFFDGCGGHFTLNEIIAWKPLNDLKVIKVDK